MFCSRPRECRVQAFAVFHPYRADMPKEILCARRLRLKRRIHRIADNLRALELETVGLEPHVALEFCAEDNESVRKRMACERKNNPLF